ncbi:MAG: hypothetical protein HGB05_13755 [Chloroflexi bacterium]|nr:hypothetical protein [Chloroflexota bacterium]
MIKIVSHFLARCSIQQVIGSAPWFILKVLQGARKIHAAIWQNCSQRLSIRDCTGGVEQGRIAFGQEIIGPIDLGRIEVAIAAAAGKDVFVEKPAGGSLSEVDALQAPSRWYEQTADGGRKLRRYLDQAAYQYDVANHKLVVIREDTGAVVD